MINIPQVTLFGVCWSGDSQVLERTQRVLRYCQGFMRAGKVELFQPRLDSLMEYNRWMVHEMPKIIQSAFAWHVHDDGFPVRPNLWTPRFLHFDYIGAPWFDGIVGNEGFSIQSRKMLQIKSTLPECNQASDTYVCRHWRRWLELKGVRFAPQDIALKFSTEDTGQELESFGFHGRNVQPRKLAEGWARIEAFERTL